MIPPVRITAAGELPLTSYDYVNAPYEVAFIVTIEMPPAVKKWTRWRRIKWRRHYLRKLMGRVKRRVEKQRDDAVKYMAETSLLLMPHDVNFIVPVLFKRGLYLSCCGGFDKHLAWCNYAPGN